MTTYIAIIITALIGLLGVIFKPDYEGKQKPKTFVNRLTGGGWIILLLLILSSLLTAKTSYDDNVEKKEKNIIDSLRWDLQRKLLLKGDSLQKSRSESEMKEMKANYEKQITSTEYQASISKLKLDNANENLATVKTNSENIQQDLTENSQPLPPLSINIKFARALLDDKDYTYNSPLRNTYLDQFSKIRIQELLTLIDISKTPKDFVISGTKDNMSFRYTAENFDNNNSFDSNFLTLNNLINSKYLPNISFCFRKANTNNQCDLQLDSKVYGTKLIPGNRYYIEYSGDNDAISYDFKLKEFKKYNNNSNIKSLLAITKGSLNINIKDCNLICFTLSDRLVIKSGRTLEYRLYPNSSFTSLKGKPSG